MKHINGIEYLESAEAMQFLEMSKSTFYDQIKHQRIKFLKFSGDTLIPKKDAIRFKNVYYKSKIDNDINQTIHNSTDTWLNDSRNRLKLQQWSKAKRTKWHECSIDDLVAYWRYIIKPKWIQSEEYHTKQAENPFTIPTILWIKHNVRCFLRAFEIKYFRDLNILTVIDFFHYIITEKKW